ncbi:hypothetical protein [Tunturiibacter gelidiferens]|uniref:Uncharacterized protein n=1 Tax=Tunturiibacter gelidiferens TaxID=3069689 RepID=A0AAU7Z130_9BACT
MDKLWIKVAAILVFISFTANGQEAQRGGVTVSAYVANTGELTTLHVTVANDNDVQ